MVSWRCLDSTASGCGSSCWHLFDGGSWWRRWRRHRCPSRDVGVGSLHTHRTPRGIERCCCCRTTSSNICDLNPGSKLWKWLKMSMPKLLNRPDLHLTKVRVSSFSVRPIYGKHFGSQQKWKSKPQCLPLKSIEIDRFFKSPHRPNTSQ